MLQTRFSVWCGNDPVQQAKAAEALRKAGATDVLESTEYVHATMVWNHRQYGGIRNVMHDVLGWRPGAVGLAVYHQHAVRDCPGCRGS